MMHNTVGCLIVWFMVKGSWLMIMTQDERWLARYNQVKGFIEREHRNPSKYRLEEHDMLNWLKARW